VECGRASGGTAVRWRAYLAAVLEDDEGDGPLEVVLFCPECAGREFGPLMPARLNRSVRDRR
jgi:hypothetical protein